MSTTAAGPLVYALHESWNERRYDALAALLAEGCSVAVMGSELRFAGGAAAGEAGRALAEALPDATVEIVALREGPGWAVAESVLRGTHSAAVSLADGRIVPPTGRPLERRLCEIVGVSGGRVSELRVYAGGTGDGLPAA